MGPGVDPHLYKASAGDVRTLRDADLIFYSGYSLEGQLGEVLDGFARRTPVVAVSEQGIPEESLIAASSGAYSYDPHVWMDVTLWSQTVDSIVSALGEAAPECADAITENAEAYKAQLAALNEWVAASIASIPETQRILVTAHDAFAYYGRAYDIEVEGIQGISTESEASLRDIRTVADTVAEREVPALFVESSINPRTIEAVLQAVQDRGFEASIGGQLFSDAMGEDGTADGTYIGMIYSNTRTVTEALGGTVAPAARGAEWLGGDVERAGCAVSEAKEQRGKKTGQRGGGAGEQGRKNLKALPPPLSKSRRTQLRNFHGS